MALNIDSASSSILTKKWANHVFLSFRGEDTRKGFTDHLFASLKRRGIKTFRDDHGLERGEVISLQLMKAIEESMFALIILSPNYASSTWCLDELQKIIECSKTFGQTVFPIFYGVEPSHVRHQRGNFAEYFRKHENRFREERGKVGRWRDALREVASYYGWDSKDQPHEATLIESIVDHIHKKLIPKLPSCADNLVGIDSWMKKVSSLITMRLNDVRFIGKWCMGGIGKTNEAIKEEFEGRQITSRSARSVKDLDQNRMARKINAIEEINDTKETWKLEIRIRNLWYTGNVQNNGFIEMIFMDKLGDKIMAIVKRFDCEKWKPQLHEGKTYRVENFEIENSIGQYKISNHPYKLVFVKGTIVKDRDIPQIPENVYHFIRFEDIMSGYASPDVLVDIIAEFVEVTKNQTESVPKKIVILLKDQRGNMLSCTLWGNYASQMERFLQKHESGPMIILLTLAKIKDSKGTYPISIQNSKYASRLLINEDIEEIREYRNSLDPIIVYECYSQRMTQMSSFSHVSSEHKFLQNAEVKSLMEINELKQEYFCLTVGKIDKVFVANGWSYDGCFKCSKKAEAKCSFICTRCGNSNPQPVSKFKLEVKVSQKKESAKFVLWNRECIHLLNKTSLELRKQLIDEGELDEMSIPEDVDSILGKTLGFKVKVQPSYRQCSVIQISEDAQTIQSIMDKIPNYEDAIICEKEKLNFSPLKSLSAIADYDPANINYLTPLKRGNSNEHLDDLASQELASSQLSTTKFTKRIKSE